jgi:hypothetical protein
VEYLLNLLKNPDIDEADAELVLVLLRDRGEDVLSRLEAFVRRFPGLSRNVYHFARHVADKEALAEIVHRFAADGAYATEDQLFWMAKLSEEFLPKTSRYRDILFSIYQHPNATDISKAKVLAGCGKTKGRRNSLLCLPSFSSFLCRKSRFLVLF